MGWFIVGMLSWIICYALAPSWPRALIAASALDIALVIVYSEAMKRQVPK